MEKKAVIYTRVSDPSQVENNSLDTQEKACRKFAKSKGYEVVKIFVEEGKSAKSISGRPELKRLLSYASKKSNRIEAVIVYKFDRFSRNLEDGLLTISLLAKYGVEVMSSSEDVDQGPMGTAMRNIMMTLGQLDNELKGERVRDNMQAVFRKGLWPFKLPIGYKRRFRTKEENKGIAPIQDPNLTPIIQKMFSKATEGIYNKSQLARMMNIWGFGKYYPNKADQKTIHNILSKTFYYGNMYAKKWDEYAMGKHMPMVDKNTWEVAYQRVVLKKKRLTFQDSSKYPLKGVIRCESCDKHMTTSPSRGRNGIVYYYECGNKGCRSIRITREDAHNKLENLMKQIKPSDRVMKIFNHMIFTEWDEIINTAKKDSEYIESRIVGLKEEISSIRKAKDDGIYTPEEAKEEAERIRQEIVVLGIERSDLKLEQYDKEIVKSFTKLFLENFHLLYEKYNLPKKQALLNAIFPDGIICLKNREIQTTNLSPSFNLIQHLETEKSKNVTLSRIQTNLKTINNYVF